MLRMRCYLLFMRREIRVISTGWQNYNVNYLFGGMAVIADN
ncbi:MAG: hypothetical protein QG599_1594 [Pseudomonadota bacterium]|nr:hypothetical protein [Pseudomonadota bacterium]